jgi:predicted glutamine amidotransferase
MDALPTFYRRASDSISAFKVNRFTSHEGGYKPQGSFMIHGRTATTEVNLGNVHPFRKDGWTLAHNGVIDWEGKTNKDRESITCDSQHLLLCLTEERDTLKAKESMQDITGYAAFLALAPSGRMIVARDATADLYAGITSKGRWIFGTTREIVESIADSWKCKGVNAYMLDDWSWLEFSSTSLEPMAIMSWSHKTATKYQWEQSGKSLGYSTAQIATATSTTATTATTATTPKQTQLPLESEPAGKYLTADELLDIMDISGATAAEVREMSEEEINGWYEYADYNDVATSRGVPDWEPSRGK